MFFRAALSAVALAGLASSTSAQALPPDIAELPAAEFAEAAARYFDEVLRVSIDEGAEPAAEQSRALVQLAWSRFLDDGDFVASSDWETVAKMASLFANRWPLLEESAVGEPSERLAVFQSAISARLASASLAEQSLESLEAIDGALEIAGVPRSELTPRAVRWMQAHDWQSLPLPARVRLSNLLHVERVPIRKFSVRWTGVLTVANGGSYVFEQLRQHHIDGVLRVRLGGQTILDSTVNARPVDDLGNRLAVVSNPVTLEAASKIPVVIEYWYDADSMVQNHEFDERIFPMAVLLWKQGDGPQEIVPPSVFATPDGAPGLEAEYFGDVDFKQSVLTRVDPGVQMIWSGFQIASEFEAEQSAVTDSCLASIRNGEMSALPDLAAFLEHDLFRLLKRVPALDRAMVVALLASDFDGLQATSCDCMRIVLLHAFMLPRDVVADYVVAWAEVRNAEASRILPYPGWGAGTYLNHCYDDYGWVGHSLRGANWSIAERLLDESLERDDGSCNLLVAYCVSQAAVHDRRNDVVRNILDDRLSDDALTGDARATWLLARAHHEEVDVGGIPRPQLGIPYLQEASLVAESAEMQFRVLQEMAARYAALGQTDALAPLLDQAAGQHPEHAQDVASWREQADALAAHYRSLNDD